MHFLWQTKDEATYMTTKVIIGFWWECDKCLEKGYVEGGKIWRFCPYCGKKLTTTDINVRKDGDAHEI